MLGEIVCSTDRPSGSKLNRLGADILLDSNRPFLLVSAKPENIGVAHMARIDTAPHAMLHSGLVDQIGVLSHPSVKWYLCHGGWASVSEAINIGVPLIIWPLAHNDQPYNAALLSTRPEPVAFELVQIRRGHALRHAKRGIRVTGEREDVVGEFKQIFADTLGEKGEEIRRNMKKMREKVKEERDGRCAKSIYDFGTTR